ncbi:MAG TPA: hypothetical protein ENK91_03200, partial [Bacteroidetes bacterium]|nr:hypothetical protein [Bacteroidota bacterium]
IFNVLATIQNKVLFEEKELAADYVVKLSKLIRNFLAISHKANQLIPGQSEYEITLSKEIELLMDFIEFEKIKNNNYFDYEIIIDPEIIPDYIMIPPMLIQPFVENSIKHGLLLSEKSGNLWLTFKKENEDLLVLIEDDGVGMMKSNEIRGKNNRNHQSLGSKIVRDRIDVLNKLGYQIHIEFYNRIPKGTIVKIILKEEL